MTNLLSPAYAEYCRLNGITPEKLQKARDDAKAGIVAPGEVVVVLLNPDATQDDSAKAEAVQQTIDYMMDHPEQFPELTATDASVFGTGLIEIPQEDK